MTLRYRRKIILSLKKLHGYNLKPHLKTGLQVSFSLRKGSQASFSCMSSKTQIKLFWAS